MLIDIDVDEVFGVDVLEDGEGLAELVVGIGDPEDTGTTVLTFIAGWDSDLRKIDILITGLQKFKEQALEAARRRADGTPMKPA